MKIFKIIISLCICLFALAVLRFVLEIIGATEWFNGYLCGVAMGGLFYYLIK